MTQTEKILAEWQRRVQENPNNFYTPEESAAMTPEEYASKSAPYFDKLNAEIKSGL